MSKIFYTISGDVILIGSGYGYEYGDYNNICNATLLMNDKNIKNIIRGTNHSIIYKNNGDVLVFGYNCYGQLGLTHNKDVSKPTLLMNDKYIKNIICSMYQTIIYKYHK